MAKSRTVTAQEKELMNELYCQIKTYAGVAREVGRSPSTVKRYIDPTYVPIADRPTLTLSEDEWQALIDFQVDKEEFMKQGASLQTDAERKEMEEIWSLLNV